MLCLPDWVDSKNRNWGSEHTDTYAWGQVAGCDNAPDAFLECATVRLRFGPLWSPPFTMAVPRIDGLDYKVNSLICPFRGFVSGSFGLFQQPVSDEVPIFEYYPARASSASLSAVLVRSPCGSRSVSRIV
jgi:hypothetical protein